MNERHLELCSSAEWAETVQRWIIPWVLDDVALGDDVDELEINPLRAAGSRIEVLDALVRWRSAATDGAAEAGQPA